jgi:hypothetical protein
MPKSDNQVKVECTANNGKVVEVSLSNLKKWRPNFGSDWFKSLEKYGCNQTKKGTFEIVQ